MQTSWKLSWQHACNRWYCLAQDAHERVSSSHEHYALLARSFHNNVPYRFQRVLTLLGKQAPKFSIAI